MSTVGTTTLREFNITRSNEYNIDMPDNTPASIEPNTSLGSVLVRKYGNTYTGQLVAVAGNSAWVRFTTARRVTKLRRITMLAPVLPGETDDNVGHIYRLNVVPTRALADRLVAKLSAFTDMDDMLNAGGHYRPTILTRGDGWATLLANAYDYRQHQRGDDRRAFRGRLTTRRERSTVGGA